MISHVALGSNKNGVYEALSQLQEFYIRNLTRDFNFTKGMRGASAGIKRKVDVVSSNMEVRVPRKLITVE